MEKIKKFIIKYKGAIVGGIISIIALLLNLHKLLIYVLIIIAGLIIGNYVQYNKESVKEKIKSYIDKL